MNILIATHQSDDRQQLYSFFKPHGDCTIATRDAEALDLFLGALKRKRPYHLLCIDAGIPKSGGIAVVKAARQLEAQLHTEDGDGTRIVMVTKRSDVEVARESFEQGCQAFVVQPVDRRKMDELLVKLNLLEAEKTLVAQGGQNGQGAYFSSVRALSEHRLEVIMETGTSIHFRFGPRLNTARFGSLQDDLLFRSVRTDGHALLFEVPGKTPVRITASEFMDLVLIDRRMMTR